MRDGEGSRHKAPGLEYGHVDRRVVSLAVDVGPEVLLPGGQGGAAQQHGAGELVHVEDDVGDICTFFLLEVLLEPC